MPRRLVLTASERESLFALPENQDDLIRYYTFNAHDLSIIRLHRGDVNRLGFAIQLCYMRYPGIILGFAERPCGTKTMYLTVNKIEEKEYSFNGKCKYYYCTTKDEDPINGYQKAIVIKKYDTVYMGLFATEIDMYLYQFSISKY